MHGKEEAQRVVVVKEQKGTEGNGSWSQSWCEISVCLTYFYHVIRLCNQPPSRITGKPIVASKNPTSIMHHRSQCAQTRRSPLMRDVGIFFFSNLDSMAQENLKVC